MSNGTSMSVACSGRALNEASVGGPTSPSSAPAAVGGQQPAGPVGLAGPAGSGVRFGATRLDSASFCARITAAPVDDAVLPAGFAFRLTLTRSADVPGADVAVSDWRELDLIGRASATGQPPALPGDFARIESGQTWTYDVRLAVPLRRGQGRSMLFRTASHEAGWTVTLTTLDADGTPVDEGVVHSF